MARPTVSELLQKIEDFDKQKDKIEYLQSIRHPVIETVLKHMFDPKLKFDLPPGEPPFTVMDFDEPGRLWAEARRFYLFTKDGNPNLTSIRKERLFIDLLESVVESDAKLVLAVKDQKSPYKGLTRKLVEKAYPGIIGANE